MKKNLITAVVSVITMIPLVCAWDALFDSIGWQYCQEWMAYAMYFANVLISGFIVDHAGTVMTMIRKERRTYISKELS